MMYLPGHDRMKRLFELFGGADYTELVGGTQKDVLRVLLPDDVCLMDTTTTDYNGRVCLVSSPAESRNIFQRIFVDGDTAIICDPTDGEENERCPLGELKVHGVVIAIVRGMEAEKRPNMEPWAEFSEKYPSDKLMDYYPMNWEYSSAVRTHERGDAGACFYLGYRYGFAVGRRAERNGKRRERRRKGVKLDG